MSQVKPCLLSRSLLPPDTVAFMLLIMLHILAIEVIYVFIEQLPSIYRLPLRPCAYSSLDVAC